MYIEANVHGNEIQGGEICLYTVWYLMENYGRLEAITRLVNERVFYLVPTINPDGRQYFMEVAGGSSRTGHIPVDDDNDGLFDEDKPNDLNANGVIEQIRKYVPGLGTHRISKLDPRLLEPVGFGETGDYLLLGQEGIDDDGDGRVNEDDVGSYDGNRNYPSDWQPNYIQSGAMDYPTQLTEARAEVEFLDSHPNIAGVQSYHNNGGMILRGPGADYAGEYPMTDKTAYDELGQNGERILPFYRYIVIWSGLYTVHGGFIDYTNDGLGMLSFSNELWNGDQYFTSPALKEQQKDPNSPIAPQKSRYFFDDKLEFGDQFVEWAPFKHPTYGDVEMGGSWKKTTSPGAAALHAGGALPPQHGLHPLPGRRAAHDQAGRSRSPEGGRRRLPRLPRGQQPQGHADHPGESGPEQRRSARPADPGGQERRGHLGQHHRQQGVVQDPSDHHELHRPEEPQAHPAAQRDARQDGPDLHVPGQGLRRGHLQVRFAEGRHGRQDRQAAVSFVSDSRPTLTPPHGGMGVGPFFV